MLAYAAQIKLWTEGRRDASTVIQDLSSSPSRATTYKKAYAKDVQADTKHLFPLRALSMIVEGELTRKQYEVRGKTEAYPNKAFYSVTETSAEDELQSLVNHTVSRLLLYLKDVVSTLSVEERN
ncbi:hypothetical protein QE152_g13630 [Popillia japonica]|uniref:Uncharacterized protein n=1 Tax=Popillia japonica TaxID=7064 RepID=A0AAW1LB65_POPJA